MKKNVRFVCKAFIFLLLFLYGTLTYAQIERWVYVYPGSQTEFVFDLVLDVNGNIYVTGDTESGSSSFDLIVVSLSPSGSERWVYTYGWYDGTDVGYAMACDSSGNLYNNRFV